MTTTSVRAGSAAATTTGAPRPDAVVVMELRTPAETDRAATLLGRVWRSGAEPPVPANLLRAVQQTGGYVFGAYDEHGAMLAASMGLLSTEGLHSHITGVLPQGQRRGLGFALKQHQRCWALERGLATVTWTCDPLVLRNTSFNLHALGADVVGYLTNHYGEMGDGVNAGDESDRFSLRWDLLGEPAVRAAQGQRRPWLDPAGRPAALGTDARGGPVRCNVDGAARLVQLPPDIEGLRRVDPPAALAWRHAVRAAVVPALAAGAVALGLTADGALVLDLPAAA